MPVQCQGVEDFTEGTVVAGSHPVPSCTTPYLLIILRLFLRLQVSGFKEIVLHDAEGSFQCLFLESHRTAHPDTTFRFCLLFFRHHKLLLF